MALEYQKLTRDKVKVGDLYVSCIGIVTLGKVTKLTDNGFYYDDVMCGGSRFQESAENALGVIASKSDSGVKLLSGERTTKSTKQLLELFEGFFK